MSWVSFDLGMRLREQLARLFIEAGQCSAGDESLAARRCCAGVVIGGGVLPGVAAREVQAQVHDRELGGRLGALQEVATAGVKLLANGRAVDVRRHQVLDRRRIRARIAEIERHGGRLLHLARRAGGIAAARGIVEHEVHAGVADRAHLAGGIVVAQGRAQIQIHGIPGRIRAHGGFAEQVEIDAVLAAFEVQIDATAADARAIRRHWQTADLPARSAGP